MSRRLALSALLLAALPGVASAEATLGLTTLTLGGELEGLEADDFRARVGASIEAAGLDLITTEALAAASGRDADALRACRDAACLEPVLDGADAHAALRIDIQGSLNIYALELEVLAANGAQLARVEATCDLCTRDELLESLGTQLEQLLGELPGAAELRLELSPSEASITLDDRPVEPPEITAPPGSHRLAASADGFDPMSREVLLRLGVPLELSLALVPSEDVIGPQLPNNESRFGPLGIAGLVLTVAGGLGIGASAVVLAIDGACANNVIDANGQCQLIYETTMGGAIGIAAAGAMLTAGVVLLVIDVVRRRRARVARAAEPASP